MASQSVSSRWVQGGQEAPRTTARNTVLCGHPAHGPVFLHIRNLSWPVTACYELDPAGRCDARLASRKSGDT